MRDAYARHVRIWNLFRAPLGWWIRRLFAMTCDEISDSAAGGPLFIVVNHSCAWDPLLMYAASSRKHFYFVASEHILRWRFLGPVINWLVEPIPRKKASLGTGTVMSCLRHLREGHSVCIFAEGEQTWNGITGNVFPATGKLARQCGATLVTYRLEGAYLALPRWARGIRRGRVRGTIVNIYTPDQLRQMKPDEITRAIDRDLHYDIWDWQISGDGGPVRYIGKGKSRERARGLEKALFICPSCRRAGNLTSKGDTISCSCGFRARYLETGFLEYEGSRQHTISEWDGWQKKELVHMIDRIRGKAGPRSTVYKDSDAELSLVQDGHKDELLGTGEIRMETEEGRFILRVGGMSFPVDQIDMMAPILSSLLLFTTGGRYYQVRLKDKNIRKYVLVWQTINNKQYNA